MRSAAFQKVSVVAVAVIALALGPVTVGGAFAGEGEPGWQTPSSKAGETISELPGDPGLQEVPGEPGWQRIANSTR
ncbi:hypothetical protein OG746_16495 [Streptomyces sp. NBC_01016]|uniref:hypothetical protein n=1 Tax=Streptomyces sp. NBC_01016 TaxID=2903720 RepID=UPI002251998A|nr:hypothetical protein [Streptomyces sp. NBC_01016]MCX4830332.1 hypothetical protein [Streptomyces sp. NBC_01016]